jgi:hypothetical protein
MLALAFAAAGVGCIVVAAILLRTVGRGYRLGRMLWAAPQVPIGDAAALSGSALRFVRVTGRVSSEEEFPDELDRPLVFRRTRVEVLDRPGRWRTLVDDREAVPFGVEARSEAIDVDTAALAEGLVVVPREATGTVADLPADLRASLGDIDPATPARLVVEQISAVEQATVAGRPVSRDGHSLLTADDHRPLIVTTLEPAAAMRLLAAGHRNRVRVAAVLIIIAALLLAGALLQALAVSVFAATPTTTPTPAATPVLIDPLDPRAGAGASLIGAPLLAAVAVVVVGVLVAVATLGYARLVGRR